MFRFIEKIQQKPKHKRKRFAFLFAGTITGIIVLSWIILIGTTNLGYGPQDETVASAQEKDPFSVIFDDLGKMVESIYDQAANVGQTIYQAATTTNSEGISTTTPMDGTTTTSSSTEGVENEENTPSGGVE